MISPAAVRSPRLVFGDERRASTSRPDRRRLVVAGAALFAGVVCALRYATLVAGHAPPGIDTGNWLAFGHDLFSGPLRSGSVYPPVVPLLELLSVRLFGLGPGVSVLATAASLAPAAALFVVLYRQGLAAWAIGLSALVLTAASTGEATAWGGFPQLLGIGLVMVFLWRLDAVLRRRSVRGALAAGLLLALLLATSHLIGAYALAAGALVVAAHLCFRVPQWGRPGRFACLGLVLLPSSALAPLYLRLARTVLASVGSRQPTTGGGVKFWASELEFTYRDARLLWRSLLIASLVILAFEIGRRRESLWILAASMFAAAPLLALATHEPRFLYLLGMPAMLSIGLWIDGLRSVAAFATVRKVAAVALTVGVASATLSGLDLFRVQRAYYGVLRPGTLQAITWLHDASPASAVVAVSPLREAPLGWWVEGVARRKTLYASPLQWLNFPEERERARTANGIFAPTFPRPEGIERVCRAGVSDVLVAKAWGGLDAAALADLRVSHPDAVAYENEDAIVLSAAALGCPQAP